MAQFTTRSKLLGSAAAVVAFAAASTAGTTPAHAQLTNLYAGGATFPEKVYRDIMNCYGDHAGTDTETGLTAPPATCNGATPYNNSVQLLYGGSGSGRGQN